MCSFSSALHASSARPGAYELVLLPGVTLVYSVVACTEANEGYSQLTAGGASGRVDGDTHLNLRARALANACQFPLERTHNLTRLIPGSEVSLHRHGCVDLIPAAQAPECDVQLHQEPTRLGPCCHFT
jgi:hypothetical protein